jgi:hypothetical protein
MWTSVVQASRRNTGNEDLLFSGSSIIREAAGIQCEAHDAPAAFGVRALSVIVGAMLTGPRRPTVPG